MLQAVYSVYFRVFGTVPKCISNLGFALACRSSRILDRHSCVSLVRRVLRASSRPREAANNYSTASAHLPQWREGLQLLVTNWLEPTKQFAKLFHSLRPLNVLSVSDASELSTPSSRALPPPDTRSSLPSSPSHRLPRATRACRPTAVVPAHRHDDCDEVCKLNALFFDSLVLQIIA